MRLLSVSLLWGLLLAGPASGQVFHDDFDGDAVDSSKWEVSNFGASSVSGGKLHLVNDSCRYPFLVSKVNPFPPSGDFLCRVGFRFTSVQRGGNGMGTIEDGVFAVGFHLWQDNSDLGLRTGFGEIGYPFLNLSASQPDTTYHVFEWRYEAGVYSFFLDGVKRGESRSAHVGDQLFIGHYEYCFTEPWSTSECDFVHVEWLNQPVPAQSASWGAVKGAYR